MKQSSIASLAVVLSCLGFTPAQVRSAALPISDITRSTPVDYPSEIKPILKANCIACHNKTTTKGGLNMETPDLMKKGGESGPAIEPGKGAASLIVQSAAHSGDSDMPPKGNKVGAVNLTGAELGLLRLWVDQGANPGKSVSQQIAWKPLPPGLHPIYAVAMSPGGEYAACSRANQIFVYDLATKTQVGQVEAHRDMVLALAFSPDGRRLASGSYGEVKVWSLQTANFAPGLGVRKLMDARAKIQQFERSAALAALDAAFYASVVAENNAEVTALKDRVKKAGDAIADTKKKLDDKRAAVKPLTDAKIAAQKAFDDLKAQLARVPADKPDAALTKTHDEAKAKAEASAKAESDALASVTAAETAAADAVEELPKVTRQLADEERAAADASSAQATSQAAQKKLAEEVAGAAKAAAELAKSLPGLAVSPDQRWIVEPLADGISVVWTSPRGIPVAKFVAKPEAKGELTWKADNTIVVPADGALEGLPATWTLERTLGTGDALSPVEDRVNALAFSPDGKTIAVGSGEPSRGGDITLWDAATGKLVRSMHDRHSDTVLSLDFSPDGRLIASGGADKQLRVSEVASGTQRKVFEGHTHHVMGVSWRADGRVLVSSGADNVAKVWDWVKSERRKNLDGWDKEVTSVRYLGGSIRLLTTSGDKQVRLIGEDGSAPVALAGTSEFMQASAASRDGQWVAAGGEDSVLRVWQAKDGAQQAAFPKPQH